MLFLPTYMLPPAPSHWKAKNSSDAASWSEWSERVLTGLTFSKNFDWKGYLNEIKKPLVVVDTREKVELAL